MNELVFQAQQRVILFESASNLKQLRLCTKITISGAGHHDILLFLG